MVSEAKPCSSAKLKTVLVASLITSLTGYQEGICLCVLCSSSFTGCQLNFAYSSRSWCWHSNASMVRLLSAWVTLWQYTTLPTLCRQTPWPARMSYQEQSEDVYCAAPFLRNDLWLSVHRSDSVKQCKTALKTFFLQDPFGVSCQEVISVQFGVPEQLRAGWVQCK